MKKILSLLVTIFAFFFSACDDVEEYAHLSIPSVVDSIAAEGADFPVEINAAGTWTLESAASWVSLSATYGADAQTVIATVAANKSVNARSSKLTLRCGALMDTVTIWQKGAEPVVPIDPENPEEPENPVVPPTDETPTEASPNEWYGDPAALRLEVPRLNKSNVFVPHYATIGGKKDINYSIEWNESMLHASWVAYTFDEELIKSVVKRTNAWSVDLDMPEGYTQVDNNYHTNDGYDRGHICASADRLSSTEVNEQTFYYSNMSPMIGGFNQKGIWPCAEEEVRKFAGYISTNRFETLYVVKGGTLNKLLVNFEGKNKGSDGKYPTTDEKGLTPKGLPVPAYYFITIMAVKNGEYNAIALYMPHSDELTPVNGSSFGTADLKKYAMSIDDLEVETGIDFYCNLPDDIEAVVESTLDLNYWWK